MNKKRQDFILNEFIVSVKNPCTGLHIDNVRWENNQLLCSLYTSFYGKIENVQIYNCSGTFKLMHNGCKVASIEKLIDPQYSPCEEFVTPLRGTNKTNRKK